MARLLDWQNNLAELIEAKRHEPFDFPTHNCLVWASQAIVAVRGDDILAEYHGKYSTERAAATLLRKLDNVTTSQALLEKHLGELRPVAFARPGDIVLVDPVETELGLPADIELFGPVPGVCNGVISYFVGELGLVEIETLRLGQALWVS
jgi:hypothetical protein